MAEAILSDAVGRILEVLASLAFQEIQLASGVKDEILKLKNTVETISGVLVDAEEQFSREKKENHAAVTIWVRRLKDAVYDADDLLDDFNNQLHLKEMMNPGNKMAKEVRIFFSNSNQIAYSLKMAHKIKAIRERLDDIKNDKQFLLLKHDTSEKGVKYNREREQTHSFVLEENVVGREDDKNAIVQLLLDSNAPHNVSVIPIVGIGGVGKTTLVQSVYNVAEVINHFQLRMWVCVSDDFTLKSIVEKIIKSITRKESEKLEMDQLQQFLREQIDGKKYLLVLDDIWNENPNRWNDLKDLLMNGARGSKILVTTRSQRVANIMTKPAFVYLLKGLPEDKSWFLFAKIAFDQGKEPKNSRLVATGKDIVAKCVGVPLAIRTIGRLLFRNYKEEDWLSFRDNELSEIDQEEDDILPILKLSYDHLSSPLKQCFAYCALFPKDYELRKEVLIQLWMAQGFLRTSKKNQCLEDVGNEYFMNLHSRAFLQDLEEKDFGIRRVVTCKMHNLMHDLAQSVVGSECKMVTSDVNNVDERSRHISFCHNLQSLNISSAMLNAKGLRTLLPLYGGCIEMNNFHFSIIISSFQSLRTLNLSGFSIAVVPTSIGKLQHLRYLNLSFNRVIKELPDSMSKLINLQTLDLTYCSSLKKLPRDTRKMVNLQYLKIEGCDSLTVMPCGLGELIDLRSLPLFVVDKRDRKNEALRELKGLNKLRGSLIIVGLRANSENVNLAEVNLEEKQYLESLSLEGVWEIKSYRYDEEIMVEGLKPHPNLKELSIDGSLGSVMFSGCMSSFANLTQIFISHSRNFRSITPLDQLPCLQLLSLRWLESVEYISESAGRVSEYSSSTSLFFPSLKKLRISDCKKLKGWWKINDEDDQVTTELVSFPCLSELTIWDCPMFTCMPLYPTLETLILKNSNTKTLQQTMMKMKTSADVDADAAAQSTPYSARPAFFNLQPVDTVYTDDLESLLKIY